ncbi:hypothetical protein SAMN05421747_10779 [Parapedobacter composti]|uniref:Transcription elongation factor, GreA/GreB, C-term n=1 Tax=Parapedobacter composti TaxID=623281 RepID=A0A1I1HRZ9_9SPHI|nr:hypothetical protein [Parapedobacter composti]SFC26605.1 hypothetical protein SAMN05421747_10779 [Parapedobacter composti]
MHTSDVSNTIKVSLLEACETYVGQRMENALQAMASASAAAADDTKSSAGDKFETTREMMQQELNRHQQLLADARRMAQVLAGLDVRAHHGPAKLGSLVETNHGLFFLAVNVGQLIIGGKTYRVISPVSPLGQRFIGSKAGDELVFNGMNYRIVNVT